MYKFRSNKKATEYTRSHWNHGADNGIRTRDPHLGKVMLYQLSHVRIAGIQFNRHHESKQVKFVFVNRISQ